MGLGGAPSRFERTENAGHVRRAVAQRASGARERDREGALEVVGWVSDDEHLERGEVRVIGEEVGEGPGIERAPSLPQTPSLPNVVTFTFRRIIFFRNVRYVRYGTIVADSLRRFPRSDGDRTCAFIRGREKKPRECLVNRGGRETENGGETRGRNRAHTVPLADHEVDVRPHRSGRDFDWQVGRRLALPTEKRWIDLVAAKCGAAP